MWSPTHIQVTIQQAKDLLIKGKNDTNNCFVTISLGKEKYQTSVKEKASANVEWKEECELKIPDQGNRAELILTCLHRNNLGIDEFLGQVTLKLNEMDVYDRPRSKWFKLESKASKQGKDKKNKERGQLEVLIAFIVKSGSLTDLNKKDKHKSSSVGGSLLSLGKGEKRKKIKQIASSLTRINFTGSKKKNKDGDDGSFNDSKSSLGTPTSINGGMRSHGQRKGEADPGVISEDEDEFVFDDNLSTKSSGSSLNVNVPGRLHPPLHNFVPRNPSPLLGGLNGKAAGKDLQQQIYAPQDFVADLDLKQIESDFSVRARTLPPPSKPPRTPQLGVQTAFVSTTPAVDVQQQQEQQQLNEWEAKLYNGKHLKLGNSDSLKRRSWETPRAPLPLPVEDKVEDQKIEKSINDDGQKELEVKKEIEQEVLPKVPKSPELPKLPQPTLVASKLQDINLNTSLKATPSLNLISPDLEMNGFNQFNASFAKFEQQNSFDFDADKKLISQSFISKEALGRSVPQAMPRNREMEAKEEIENRKRKEAERKQQQQKQQEEEDLQRRRAEEDAQKQRAEEDAQKQRAEEDAQKQRAEEDARFEEELRLNEQRLREEEQALQDDLLQLDEQKRREAKRREEDQRILNFTSRSTSLEEDSAQSSASPQKSPAERTNVDKREKRLSKFKYLIKRDKAADNGRSSPSPKPNKRIIIGHEKSTTQAERRSEIQAALSKKYEGKSREELMLIANGMENEALLQRQRVKELEDYLDNLLLRVMETHPKILQNPYSRTTSAKSG